MEEASNTITLQGSTEIVTEFFEYSINSILYQRGIYPPESFKRVAKYGLAMMFTTDDALVNYINNIMRQLKEWLLRENVQKLVLVIKGVESKESLERWVFNCDCSGRQHGNTQYPPAEKSQKEITQEIQAIIRQITASVTFLPLLNEPCHFDLLIYTDKDAAVPLMWEDSDACLIDNAENVQLRSFDTKMHKINASVSYRVDSDGI